jgi:hypothetical protein
MAIGEKMSKHVHHHLAFGVIKSEGIQTVVALDDNLIQLRAYQIHQEKGGSDIDNWLEAERSLKKGG